MRSSNKLPSHHWSTTSVHRLLKWSRRTMQENPHINRYPWLLPISLYTSLVPSATSEPHNPSPLHKPASLYHLQAYLPRYRHPINSPSPCTPPSPVNLVTVRYPSPSHISSYISPGRNLKGSSGYLAGSGCRPGGCLTWKERTGYSW